MDTSLSSATTTTKLQSWNYTPGDHEVRLSYIRTQLNLYNQYTIPYLRKEKLNNAYQYLLHEIQVCVLLLKQDKKRFTFKRPDPALLTEVMNRYIPECRAYAQEIKEIVEC